MAEMIAFAFLVGLIVFFMPMILGFLMVVLAAIILALGWLFEKLIPTEKSAK